MLKRRSLLICKLSEIVLHTSNLKLLFCDASSANKNISKGTNVALQAIYVSGKLYHGVNKTVELPKAVTRPAVTYLSVSIEKIYEMYIILKFTTSMRHVLEIFQYN